MLKVLRTPPHLSPFSHTAAKFREPIYGCMHEKETACAERDAERAIRHARTEQVHSHSARCVSLRSQRRRGEELPLSLTCSLSCFPGTAASSHFLTLPSPSLARLPESRSRTSVSLWPTSRSVASSANSSQKLSCNIHMLRLPSCCIKNDFFPGFVRRHRFLSFVFIFRFSTFFQFSTLFFLIELRFRPESLAKTSSICYRSFQYRDFVVNTFISLQPLHLSLKLEQFLKSKVFE